MHGGYRQGSGRKKGFSAKNAEEARRYLSQRVAEELSPLVDALIEQAKDGNLKAMQILLDRAWGRPRQEIQLKQEELEQKPSPEVLELAKRLNYELHPVRCR